MIRGHALIPLDIGGYARVPWTEPDELVDITAMGDRARTYIMQGTGEVIQEWCDWEWSE